MIVFVRGSYARAQEILDPLPVVVRIPGLLLWQQLCCYLAVHAQHDLTTNLTTRAQTRIIGYETVKGENEVVSRVW